MISDREWFEMLQECGAIPYTKEHPKENRKGESKMRDDQKWVKLGSLPDGTKFENRQGDLTIKLYEDGSDIICCPLKQHEVLYSSNAIVCPVTPPQAAETGAISEDDIRADERAKVLREVFDKAYALHAETEAFADKQTTRESARYHQHKADGIDSVITLIVRLPGFEEDKSDG